MTDSEIKRHMGSPEWAFAMGDGCAMEGAHPTLRGIRERVVRLRERYRHINAVLQEHS